MPEIDESPSAQPSSRVMRWAGAALVLLVLIVYARVWQAGFIWDDDAHVTENPCVVGPQGLADIWTSAQARICPLVLSTFWLEHQLWGLRTLPFHLVTLAFHAANAWLLWRLLRALGVRGAWLGAALWAVHPVQVETAAWITELKNTQSGCFFLLCVMSFVRWLKSPADEKRYALAVLWAALAMASKSSTVVLPVVLGLVWWWVDKRWPWRAVGRLLPFAGLALLSSLLSIWTQTVEGGIDTEWHRSVPERLMTAGWIAWAYLGKLLWPHPLIFIYPPWELQVTEWPAFLPSLLLLATGLVLWWRQWEWRAAFMTFAFFIVALLPVLGLVDHYFLRYSFVGDHFQYLASMAPMALLGAAIVWLGARWRPWAVTVPGGVILGVYAVLSWSHSGIFTSSLALWSDTVARNPSSWSACNNLAREYVISGQHQAEAMALLTRTLELRERNPEAHNNLGTLLLKQGLTEEGMKHLRRTLELDPRNLDARLTLGSALLQQGQRDNAIEMWQAALAIEPALAQAHENLAVALLQKSQNEAAMQHALKAVVLRPQVATAHDTLGAVLLATGRADDAITEHQKSLSLDPSSAVAHYNLAAALRAAHRIVEALSHYQKAMEAMPANPQIPAIMAWILATCPDASVRDAERAVPLALRAAQASGGQDAASLRIVAAALAASGQFPAAIQTAQQALSLADHQPLKQALEQELSFYQRSTPITDPSLAPRP